jgi:hypothetical protein
MKAHMLIAFLTVLLALALGMIVTRRARHLLPRETKLELAERFSQLRIFGLVPLFGFIVIAYFKPALSWTVCSFAVCIASLYAAKWLTVKRVAVPDAYLRVIAAEFQIVVVGLLAFLAAGLWPYYGA